MDYIYFVDPELRIEDAHELIYTTDKDRSLNFKDYDMDSLSLEELIVNFDLRIDKGPKFYAVERPDEHKVAAVTELNELNKLRSKFLKKGEE